MPPDRGVLLSRLVLPPSAKRRPIIPKAEGLPRKAVLKAPNELGIGEDGLLYIGALRSGVDMAYIGGLVTGDRGCAVPDKDIGAPGLV